MKYTTYRVGFKLTTILTMAAMASIVYADGYRNPPPTAEGMGKSGVHMVFVEDASAMSYNPANLVYAEGASIVAAATMAKLENTYTGPGGPVDSNDEWVLLPNLYASLPVGDGGIVLGLGLTTPFGQGIDWNSADVYNPILPLSLYEAQISLININPSVAFKLGDSIAVGLGADIFYSELEFKALVAPPIEAEAEGDGIGVGANLGLTWDMTDRQRLVFTYRSEVSLEYEGDFKVTPGTPLVDSTFGLEIVYPTLIGAGYGIALTETIRVEANIEWAEWSVNEAQNVNLGANGQLPPIPQNWEDTISAGFGGDWQFAESWKLFAGYKFLESPVPNSTISPTLPDADQHAFSLGLGYTTGGHTIHAAYTFSIYEDREVTAAENPAYPGTYEIDSNLVGLTYSYLF